MYHFLIALAFVVIFVSPIAVAWHAMRGDVM